MLVAVIILFLLSGFFSGSETGFIASNKVKIRHLARRKGNPILKRGARIAIGYIQDPAKFLVLALVGTNVTNIGATTLATVYLSGFLTAEKAEIASILIMSPLLLIGAEIIPKNLFYNYANTLVPLVAIPLRIFEGILYPLVLLSNMIVKPLTGRLREKRNDTPFVTRREFLALLDETEMAEDFDDKTVRLIRRILEMDTIRVGQFMIPGSRVAVISTGSPVSEAVKLFRESECKFLPVLDGDRVRGVVYIPDLLMENPTNTIDDFAKRPYYTSEDVRTLELLMGMKKSGEHRAVVLNRNHRFKGIVDLSDIANLVFKK